MLKDNENNRIGYRYLFDSKGCSLSNRKEMTINLNVSDKYDVQIYFGPKPIHGIHIVSNYSKYFIPGTASSLGTSEFKSEIDPSSKHGPFFLEIVVSTEAADTVETNNVITHDLLLKQAGIKKDEFKNVIYLIAGVIGLRFHRQFVMELLNENSLAWERDIPVKSQTGPVLENLELISLNDNGINQLEALKKSFASFPIDRIQKDSLIFHWLLRAWHERDNLYTFITLFIPLETLLSSLNDSKMSKKDKRHAKSIRMLIKKDAGERSEDLQCFFERLVQRTGPTLNEMFTELAETAKLPGWEADIKAFRQFNQMRNILLHGADKNVQQNLSVGDKEVRTLSDLVERYVNYFFFKDNNVYRSRWRPEIRDTDNKNS